MAKVRMVNTRFWVDAYISNLDPIEKLLFLYLLTNPYTEICGVYELPIKHIALETGIDKEMVEKILKRFEKDKKVIYRKGWVAVVNFAKHQLKNPKVAEGIKRGLELAPREIIDSLSIDYDSLSHSNSNSNSNLKGDIPSHTIRDFLNKGETYLLYKELFYKQLPIELVDSEFDKFILYWTEPNKSGLKQRWEQQPTFEIKRRLVTWLSKHKEWSDSKNNKFKAKMI